MRGKTTYIPLDLASVSGSVQPEDCLRKRRFRRIHPTSSDGLDYSDSATRTAGKIRSQAIGDHGDSRTGLTDGQLGHLSQENPISVCDGTYLNSTDEYERGHVPSSAHLVSALTSVLDSSISSPTNDLSGSASTKASTTSVSSTTASESASWHKPNDSSLALLESTVAESQVPTGSVLEYLPQGPPLTTSIQRSPPLSTLDQPPRLPTRPPNLILPSLSHPNLPSRPPPTPASWPRRPIHAPPTLGQVYYMPDGKLLPDSIIHHQKRQERFFKHPMLVVGLEGNYAYFYALTKSPPWAIRELNMCLRLGNTAQDDGAEVLQLAYGSAPMLSETWVNLEQRFHIEWPNLDQWAVDVRVDPSALQKIQIRVNELEANQNRYLYKPLPQDMRTIQPGMVLMLLNPRNSATLGAPVLVVRNAYPHFEVLRIKPMEDNVYFNVTGPRKNTNSRSRCLEITRQPKMGHDGTPVMLLEPESPGMREPSYVEVCLKTKSASVDMCRTWCWPPVRVRPQSMRLLEEYMARLSGSAAWTAGEGVTDAVLTSRASSVLRSLAPPVPYVMFTTSSVPGSMAYGLNTPVYAFPHQLHGYANQYTTTGPSIIAPMHTHYVPPPQAISGYSYPHYQQYRGNHYMPISWVGDPHLTSAYPRQHASSFENGYVHSNQGGETGTTKLNYTI